MRLTTWKSQYLLDAGAEPFIGALKSKAFPYKTSLEVAELLIKLGYDPTQRASESSCPSALENAVRDLDVNWLTFFEKHKISFESVSWTPLVREIVLGTVESVAKELARGADLTGLDTWHRTPLMTAVRSGNLDKAKLLFNANADFRPDTLEEAAILECAIECTNSAMLAWLIDIGIDVDVVVRSETLLMTAAEIGNAPVVALLLTHGANVFTEDDCQIQAINKATNIEVVKLLVEAGADINKVDGTGMFLLKAAVEARDFLFFKGLLELGADVQTNNFGFTALHQAANYDQLEMMRLLLAAGADPNQINEDIGQYRPLCYVRSREAALILLDAGADPTDINEFHQSAVMFHSKTAFADVFTQTRKNRGTNK